MLMTTNASTEMRSNPHHNATYYELLEIEPDASGEAIKRAYRRKARELHPDANPGDPNAAERFDQITTAYETLADHHQRAAYDRQAGLQRRRRHKQAAATHQPSGPQQPTGPGHAAQPASGTARKAGGRPPGPKAPRRPAGESDDGRRSMVDRENEATPPELPYSLANYLSAALVAAPIPWLMVGAPGLMSDNLSDVAEWHLLIAGFAWVCSSAVASAFLWARSPSMPKSLPTWRAPGWDGTALLVRLITFAGLTWMSTIVLLAPYTGQDARQAADAVLWAIWALTLGLCWFISGQVPARMGYISRFDRYWGLRGNRLPRKRRDRRRSRRHRPMSRPRPDA